MLDGCLACGLGGNSRLGWGFFNSLHSRGSKMKPGVGPPSLYFPHKDPALSQGKPMGIQLSFDFGRLGNHMMRVYLWTSSSPSLPPTLPEPGGWGSVFNLWSSQQSASLLLLYLLPPHCWSFHSLLSSSSSLQPFKFERNLHQKAWVTLDFCSNYRFF